MVLGCNEMDDDVLGMVGPNRKKQLLGWCVDEMVLECWYLEEGEQLLHRVKMFDGCFYMKILMMYW